MFSNLLLSFLVFTNVAETSDGGVYWEGMDEIPQGVDITSWLGERWTPGNILLSSDQQCFCF